MVGARMGAGVATYRNGARVLVGQGVEVGRGGIGVAVAMGVGAGVWVGKGVLVGVAVSVGEGVAEGVKVSVGVGDGEAVEVKVGHGVRVAISEPSALNAWSGPAASTSSSMNCLLSEQPSELTHRPERASKINQGPVERFSCSAS